MRSIKSASILCLVVLFSIFVTPVNAQSTWVPDLKVGDSFVYYVNPHLKSSFTYRATYAGIDSDGRHFFNLTGHPRFQRTYYTPNMTFIGFVINGTIPHTFNSNHPHTMGSQWGGRFRATHSSYSYEKQCRVDDKNPNYMVGSVRRHAMRVRCNGHWTNQTDRQDHTTWFDTKTGLLLRADVNRSSGNRSWAMTSMTLMPR